MTDAPDAPEAEPPVTGHEAIDAALAGLELGPDVHAHPDRISTALDAVTRALQTPPPAPGDGERLVRLAR